VTAAHLLGPAVARPMIRKGCTDKLVFASRAEAMIRAKISGNLHPYRCANCDQWHNTSQRGTNRK